VKVLYRGALVLWLVSGFAIHAYFSRAAQGTIDAGQGQGISVRSSENDGAARQTHEAAWDSRMKLVGAFAAWAFLGFALGLRGVHLLFRSADRVSDVEKFLAPHRSG